MPKRIGHVVGTGTIGEPLVGLPTDFLKEIGLDTAARFFRASRPRRGSWDRRITKSESAVLTPTCSTKFNPQNP